MRWLIAALVMLPIAASAQVGQIYLPLQPAPSAPPVVTAQPNLTILNNVLIVLN